MRLASIKDGSRDGQLVIVSHDGLKCVSVPAIAPNLQTAVENWTFAEPELKIAAARLEAGDYPGIRSFDATHSLAPLPRAWQWLDGSAFTSHGDLMSQVFGIDPSPRDRPLMYQGLSDRFLAWNDDVPFPSEADGIDFEGEFGVIVDEVPMGVSADIAATHIRLLVQINDWSLRTLAPVEMKTGFGWVQAKPACSMAPLAITPDELGDAWQGGKIGLELEVEWNGRWFGSPTGDAMAFSFPDLVAHAARTRTLVAGTILGSGTVSNDEYRTVGSTCIAERRGIEIVDKGTPQTPYMRFGDTVQMAARTTSGTTPFGVIAQTVIQG